ncbi:MAG: hypothetical protein KGH75_14165 [Rhodospirillales bacterium]|nr:hypothetical protein [Rhodospirillales bacterium]MDE1907586.1 hypothetical protein [Rhodospirillales bacterium]
MQRPTCSDCTFYDDAGSKKKDHGTCNFERVATDLSESGYITTPRPDTCATDVRCCDFLPLIPSH